MLLSWRTDSSAFNGIWCFFFFQAEDGIRDLTVTGVQTCALPISQRRDPRPEGRRSGGFANVSRFEQMDTDAAEVSDRSRAHGCIPLSLHLTRIFDEIGRASCRERV